MKSWKSLRRVGAALVVVSAAIAAALVGGASTGRAATSFNVTLTPLIGTTGIEIPQVSYGGKIGFHLFVQNSGNSNTQHASVTVTSTLATFSDTDNANCILNSKDSHQMICTPFGGTFAPGAIFEANLRFTAPATGPPAGVQVSTSAAISVAAQTVGGSNNNGTTLATSNPVLTNIVENTTKNDSYLHKNEKAATGNLSLPGHPQNFSLNTPKDKLLGNPFGIAVSIHDIIGTPAECADSATPCFGAFTQLNIPAASLVSALGNPFYDGTTFNPYSWAMNAQYASGSNFKLNGVYHIDDNGEFQQLLKCDDPLVGGAPSVAYPICYDTLDQIKNKKMLIATGRGLENGGLGWN
ncbi:MAG TPA: hypothetical protein VF232_09340 [Gaiellaceae bacterium]